MESGARSLILLRAGSFARPQVDAAAAFRAWLLATGHAGPTHCIGCAAYYPT
jgi:hypothetical protein